MALANPSQVVPRQPPVLAGFSHINRYWDKKMAVHTAKILPGEYYVSMHGEMVVTVLGSCVAACIRDKAKGIGGMNHFMLPEQSENSQSWGVTAHAVEARYGNWAMEALINEILKRGGRRGYLEVKLFGGGRVLGNHTDIGGRNIAFVRNFLEEEGLTITAEDLGGTRPRKVLYFSDTGACKVRRLNTVSNDTVFNRERVYAKRVATTSTDGEIELF